MPGLKDYDRSFKIVTKLAIDPVLDRYGVATLDRIKYYNFVKEMCKSVREMGKAFNINGFINEYAQKVKADREILSWFAKKRDSICSALEPEKYVVSDVLRKKYTKY
jgi:hypothetical protein